MNELALLNAECTSRKNMNTIIPYTCVFIDADWKDFLHAAVHCLKCYGNRDDIIRDLQTRWTSDTNSNHVLPCLSVRTGLDLYLKVKRYPPGSEVIMSAINIPDMVTVLQHHNLKIVPIDISIDTTGPKLDLLPTLISDKTVAILIAHIYGKWCDMDPVIAMARKYNLNVIEDCAECFCGFDRLGHTETDLSLFSFGVIKYFTSLGGAIAKIKHKDIYEKMTSLYSTYTTQKRSEYLKKILKYFIPYLLLNCPAIIKPGMYFTRSFNIDHKKYVVNMLRGFPDQMMARIRQQPSTALLHMLRRRFESFSQSEYSTSQVKGEYVRKRLPEDAQLVGMEAHVNHYWLFPILVDQPDYVVKLLNAMGIDAYRGATQLNIVEAEPNTVADKHATFDQDFTTEARYLIDHAVYLPVNKTVPFHVLDHVCWCVHRAIKLSNNSPEVQLNSKL